MFPHLAGDERDALKRLYQKLHRWKPTVFQNARITYTEQDDDDYAGEEGSHVAADTEKGTVDIEL